jgi:GntR family transcriptional regulator
MNLSPQRGNGARINPNSPVPKYFQLREILLDLIETELAADSPIPSERELCERYGLSRMTVRQAVDSLVADGKLFKVQGRGTFVSKLLRPKSSEIFVAKPKTDLQIRLASFTQDMQRRGMVPASRTLAFERLEAPAHLARELGIAVGDPIVRLERLRFADGIPMAVERNHLPEVRVPGLLTDGVPRSLYEHLAERYGYNLTWGEQTIEASTADAEDAPLLDIPTGGVVLRMTRRSYAGDVLIEYDVASYRADRYQLWVPLEPPTAPITNPHASARRHAYPSDPPEATHR